MRFTTINNKATLKINNLIIVVGLDKLTKSFYLEINNKVVKTGFHSKKEAKNYLLNNISV